MGKRKVISTGRFALGRRDRVVLSKTQPPLNEETDGTVY